MPGYTRSTAALLLLIMAVVLPAACGAKQDAEFGEYGPGSVLQIERNGLVYTYHLATRSEALFDQKADPKCLTNLIKAHPEVGRKLRLTLEDELGVPSLDEIDDARHIEDALRGLGYI